MISTLALVAAIALAPAQIGREDAKDHSGKPPRQYQADGTVTVRFSSDVAKDCREAGLQGHVAMTEACAVIGPEGTTIIVPNPCRQVGNYARRMCHELGHANGWSPEHGL